MGTDLFTFGEALSVFISSDTDSVMSATKYERVTAGAEVNVAVALSRLGLKAQFFSRFGNDQLGSVMLADIEADAGAGMGAFENIHNQPTPNAFALAINDR